MRSKDFTFTGSIVEHICPESGFFIIEAWGGEGGGVNKPKGAYSKSFVLLKKGTKLFILVGEGAGTGRVDTVPQKRCGGGGGGTFISKGDTISTSTPLCVAGGGGSQMHIDTISNFAHGQSTQVGGDAGNRLQTPGQGGLSDIGSGGGGFYGNGNQGSSSSVRFGNSFVSGGSRNEVTSIFMTAYGGFGGGASNHGNCGQPAGGGGYSGGSSYGNNAQNGGGGGSFHTSSKNKLISFAKAGYEFMPNPKGGNEIKGNSGNGYARITLYQAIDYLPNSWNPKHNTHLLRYVSFLIWILNKQNPN